MHTARWQSSTTIGMSWLTTRKVWPWALRRRMKLAMVSRITGCTAAKGSSRSARRGGAMKHMPNSRSLRCPPESCPASRYFTAPSVSSSSSDCARASASRSASPRASPAVSRLSNAEMRVKTRVIWNMRSSPRRASATGARPVTSSSASHARPESGARNPESMLSTVVLPEPFGPMRPRISPSSTANARLSTAATPPKCLVSPSLRRRLICGASRGPTARCGRSARTRSPSPRTR